MTSARHTSGIDRIQEVAQNLANHTDASASTVCTRISNADELFDPNVVKVVTDKNGHALYFSRASISWDREHFAKHQTLPPFAKHYRHIGLYACRAGFLRRFINWPIATMIKWNHWSNCVFSGMGKNSCGYCQTGTLARHGYPEDLERVRQMFAE